MLERRSVAELLPQQHWHTSVETGGSAGWHQGVGANAWASHSISWADFLHHTSNSPHTWPIWDAYAGFDTVPPWLGYSGLECPASVHGCATSLGVGVGGMHTGLARLTHHPEYLLGSGLTEKTAKQNDNFTTSLVSYKNGFISGRQQYR